MSVKQLKAYLDLNREELCQTIREGKYIPQPIRGKELSAAVSRPKGVNFQTKWKDPPAWYPHGNRPDAATGSITRYNASI